MASIPFFFQLCKITVFLNSCIFIRNSCICLKELGLVLVPKYASVHRYLRSTGILHNLCFFWITIHYTHFYYLSCWDCAYLTLDSCRWEKMFWYVTFFITSIFYGVTVLIKNSKDTEWKWELKERSGK